MNVIRTKRILLVEDDPEVADTTRMVLDMDGHTVEIAGSGEEAIAVYEPGKYDVVIVDFRLPKINGLSVTRAIKERSATQPVILLTAHAEALAQDGQDLSPFAFVLEKPFAVRQMQAALAKIFGGG